MVPDTMSYLLLGLAAVAVLMGILVASFVIRYRNVEQDLALLQQLAEEEQR